MHYEQSSAPDHLNKRINGAVDIDLTAGGAITYNHLNLPKEILVKDDNGAAKGKITYIYDAAGNKLKKITEEDATAANGNIKTVTTTIYIGGFVYESKTDNNSNTTDYTDKLQFAGHEEGRIRFKEAVGANPASYHYDYMVKDHLGNVRMVLTEERQVDKYPVASLEDAKLSIEQQYYTINAGNIVAAISLNTPPPAYINDNGIQNNPEDPAFEQANSQKLYKLNSTTNKTGLGITLKVMAGDKIDIFGKSYWVDNNTGGSGVNVAPVVLDLLSGLMGAPTGAAAGGHTTAEELNSVSGVTAPVGNFIDDPARNDGGYPQRPKAFIKYIFLDEQFKYADGGFSAVNNTAGLKDHFNDLQNLTASKNGYVYIYVSNESPVNVFFDNLQVVHSRSPILEETHYYPFGLTMTGISSKALNFGGRENKYKFNGGTELENKEFSDGSGLDLYATDFRSYDPQIGRFHQPDFLAAMSFDQSPYAFVNNNPILFIDPLGLDTIRSAAQPTKINPGDVWVKPGENGSEWYYNYNPDDPNAAQNGDLQGYVSAGSSKTLEEVTVTSTPRQQTTTTPNDRVPATNIPSGITFGRNANRNVVSQYTVNTLSDIMRASGNPNIVITSTLRTPEDQARAMYNNIVSRGVQYNLNLYGPAGDRVVNVAAQGQQQGLTRDEILAAMAAEIRRIGPGRVSRHAGDPNVINVLDISPHSIRNRQAFVQEIRARGIFLIQPPRDPAYHLEIRQ